MADADPGSPPGGRQARQMPFAGEGPAYQGWRAGQGHEFMVNGALPFRARPHYFLRAPRSLPFRASPYGQALSAGKRLVGLVLDTGLRGLDRRGLSAAAMERGNQKRHACEREGDGKADLAGAFASAIGELSMLHLAYHHDR